MQKPVAVGVTTLTLLFGGAGVAPAAETVTPVPAATTTVSAAYTEDDDSDNAGLWSLAGLLGLVDLRRQGRRLPRESRGRDSHEPSRIRGCGQRPKLESPPSNLAGGDSIVWARAAV
jgi:hypothetical protein